MVCVLTSVETEWSLTHTHTHTHTHTSIIIVTTCHCDALGSVNPSHTQTKPHTNYAQGVSCSNVTQTHCGRRLYSNNICPSLVKDKRTYTGKPEAHTVQAEARSLLPCPTTQGILTYALAHTDTQEHRKAHVHVHCLMSESHTLSFFFL